MAETEDDLARLRAWAGEVTPWASAQRGWAEEAVRAAISRGWAEVRERLERVEYAVAAGDLALRCANAEAVHKEMAAQIAALRVQLLELGKQGGNNVVLLPVPSNG